jgi:putative ABC transport system permease protein
MLSLAMLKIALRSLVHEKGKFAAALAGVAFAATLVLAQSGLYVGFQESTTNVITRVGGDLWVMARGTRLLDHSDELSSGVRSLVSNHPCVASVRGVIFSWVPMRTSGGAPDMVQLIGFEPGVGALLPWSLRDGLPIDLHGPMRVAVDAADLPRMQVAAPAIGAAIQLMDQQVYIGALTSGIRSFTVAPYVFAEASTAQLLLGLASDQFTYWAINLHDKNCGAGVAAIIARNPDLEVHGADDFAAMTSAFWLNNAGVGALLGFSALLGLTVGMVIVGQTLFAVTENHLRELAALKAIGASSAELAGFVAWQALAFAVLGGTTGLLLALALQRAIVVAGLSLVLSPGVVATGTGSTLAMCILSSVMTVRRLFRVQPAEVFR